MTTTPPRKLKTGEFLFKEGDPSQSLYIIKKGSIGIRKLKGGAYVELAKVCTNEILGELSFFDRLPRSASAVALTEVEVLEVTFESMDKIYATIPIYMRTIIASLADRLRKANDMIRRLQKNVVVGESTEQASAAANDESKSGNSDPAKK